MSAWKDIRDKSLGQTVRKEDLPPVDPNAEKKRQEDTARWYARMKEKRDREERKNNIHNIAAFIGGLLTVILLLVASYHTADWSVVPFVPFIGFIEFWLCKVILMIIDPINDDWDY